MGYVVCGCFIAAAIIMFKFIQEFGLFADDICRWKYHDDIHQNTSDDTPNNK